MNHMMSKPLFGKQESLNTIQESWNQPKISKDSRIMLIKILSCGPLSVGFCATNKISNNQNLI